MWTVGDGPIGPFLWCVVADNDLRRFSERLKLTSGLYHFEDSLCQHLALPAFLDGDPVFSVSVNGVQSLEAMSTNI